MGGRGGDGSCELLARALGALSADPHRPGTTTCSRLWVVGTRWSSTLVSSNGSARCALMPPSRPTSLSASREKLVRADRSRGRLELDKTGLARGWAVFFFGGGGFEGVRRLGRQGFES